MSYEGLGRITDYIKDYLKMEGYTEKNGKYYVGTIDPQECTPKQLEMIDELATLLKKEYLLGEQSAKLQRERHKINHQRFDLEQKMRRVK